MNKFDQRLEQAARAAWLYYVGGKTQDEIAVYLNVSRPGAQRLIALARDAGLIKVRIDFPVADCMVLADQLSRKFNLDFCDVVPTDASSSDADIRYLAVAGAARLEAFVMREKPTIINLGAGRTLRAAVEAMSPYHRRQHRFVSVIGNVARDGSSNPFDAVMVLADKTGGRRFLLPAPLVADSPEERDQFLHQRVYQIVRHLAESAEATFVGIGKIARDAQLYTDGFITDADVDELMAMGAVGEILGWALDCSGRLIESSVNARLTSVPLQSLCGRPLIALAGGVSKGLAVRAALQGGWLTGLVTDEAAAKIALATDVELTTGMEDE